MAPSKPPALTKLPALCCPICRQPMACPPFKPNNEGAAPTAVDWESCLRKCASAARQLAASNGRTKPAWIDRDPLLSVPTHLRAGLMGALDEAVTLQGKRKRWRFCSSNSEDKLTWLAFNGVGIRGAIQGLLKVRFAHDPDLLFWGVGAPGANKDLGDASVALKETAGGRTEPDVWMTDGELLVIFEVKLGSGNDTEPAHSPKWNRYLTPSGVQAPAFSDPNLVRATKQYQLARNWALGWAWCHQRPARRFILVNLVSAVRSPARDAYDRFEKGLSPGLGRFEILTWAELFQAAPLDPVAKRLLKQRGFALPPGA